MPPRHTYWTIILEDKPTAFRAHTQEELLPTLRQLQARHPDAVMKWFARGRLWHTPEEERMAAALKRRPPVGEKRTQAWRPGGDHKDPRDRFHVTREEKRRRFAESLRRERPAPPRSGTQGPAGTDRPPRPAPAGHPPGSRDAERKRGTGKPRDRQTRPTGKPGDHQTGPPGRPGDRPPWRGQRPTGRPGGPPTATGHPPDGAAGRSGQRPPPRPDSRKGGGGKGGGGQGR